MSEQLNKTLHTCKLCKKNPAKEMLFCEECLAPENRDKNFWDRVRVVVARGKEGNQNSYYFRKMKGGIGSNG